jgi:hypothetical protein
MSQSEIHHFRSIQKIQQRKSEGSKSRTISIMGMTRMTKTSQLRFYAFGLANGFVPIRTNHWSKRFEVACNMV